MGLCGSKGPQGPVIGQSTMNNKGSNGAESGGGGMAKLQAEKAKINKQDYIIKGKSGETIVRRPG